MLTYAIQFAALSAAFLGTIFAGAYAWTKLGGHKSLLVFLPALGASMVMLKPHLPLVKVFTPDVLAGVILSHVAAGALVASIIAPYVTKKVEEKIRARKERA